MKRKQNLTEKILEYKNYKIQLKLEHIEEELDGLYKERR